jgi:hypothetical protein
LAEYVSCPRCDGSGIVPLEDAERDHVHASVERGEQQRIERQREEDMVRTRLDDRLADAAERARRFESLMSGGRARG